MLRLCKTGTLLPGPSTAFGKYADRLRRSQIAAARYASHLSGCMGLGGSRRSGARGSAAAAARPNGFPRCGPISALLTLSPYAHERRHCLAGRLPPLAHTGQIPTLQVRWGPLQGLILSRTKCTHLGISFLCDRSIERRQAGCEQHADRWRSQAEKAETDSSYVRTCVPFCFITFFVLFYETSPID